MERYKNSTVISLIGEKIINRIVLPKEIGPEEAYQLAKEQNTLSQVRWALSHDWIIGYRSNISNRIGANVSVPVTVASMLSTANSRLTIDNFVDLEMLKKLPESKLPIITDRADELIERLGPKHINNMNSQGIYILMSEMYLTSTDFGLGKNARLYVQRTPGDKDNHSRLTDNEVRVRLNEELARWTGVGTGDTIPSAHKAIEKYCEFHKLSTTAPDRIKAVYDMLF